MIWLWLLLAEPIHSQSPCTRGHPGQLATVAVWVKHNDSLTTFRISDEDLTDEGFQKSPADRDLFQVQLGRQPGSCPVGLCALRLSSSKKKKDEVFLQQEDIYPLPEGYENLQDDFYCGRAYGDCGANVPIYRLTRGKGPDAIPAYSIDSTASVPGFSRDPRPICYGWSDGTGMRRPVSGDGCLKYQSVANGQIIYSVEETSSLAVGTTATLHCSSGYLSTGPSSALCTRTGWNPKDLGTCSKSNRPTAPVNLLSTGSANNGAACTAAATVKNAEIIYSQLEHSGKLPSGTSASVLCNLGYVATATSSPKCDNGDWIGQWPSCVSAEKVHCPPMATPSGSKISYEPSETPLSIGSTATLSCPSGSAIAGATRSTCGKTGWQPKSLGLCVSGLPCLALAVLGGTPNYIQANPNVPYAAGTSAIITCNAGYILQGSGSSVCSNGQWSPAPGTCILSSTGIFPGTMNSGSIGASCLDLLAPLPGSGSITYSLPAATLGTHPSATVATLTCSLGTTVSGSLSATCTSGVWSPPTLGTCVASTIGGIGGVPGIGGNSLLECANPVVVNGQISYSTSSAIEPVKPVGSVATLTCNGGFIVSGTASATCQSGIWSPPLGTCNPTLGSIGSPGTGSCLLGVVPPLGATVTYSNGALVGPYPSGTQARLTCPGGGVSSGSIQATCSNGLWNPATFGLCPPIIG